MGQVAQASRKMAASQAKEVSSETSGGITFSSSDGAATISSSEIELESFLTRGTSEMTNYGVSTSPESSDPPEQAETAALLAAAAEDADVQVISLSLAPERSIAIRWSIEEAEHWGSAAFWQRAEKRCASGTRQAIGCLEICH